MTPAFRNLMNRHAMPAFERQLAYFDWLGDRAPQLSLATGEVRLGGDTYRLQLLGSRADESNSWRWAWAAQAPGVFKEALDAAKKVRQVGRKRAIAELAEETFPLEALGLDAHTLALVAASIAELPAYEVFPYRGGALYAGLEIPALALPEPDPARLADVMRNVIDRLDVEPKVACAAYLESRGAKVDGAGGRLVGRFADGRTLSVSAGASGVEITEGQAGGGARGDYAGERPGA